MCLLPPLFIHGWFTGDEYIPSPLSLCFAGLLGMNLPYACTFFAPLPQLALRLTATSKAHIAQLGEVCAVCYHSGQFHTRRPSLVPETVGIQADQCPPVPAPPSILSSFPQPTGPASAPIPSSLVPPFSPPTGSAPLMAIGSRLAPLPGVPSNQSAPILRAFQPYRSPPSSTSEENRRKSMIRMSSSTKGQQKKTRKTAKEPPEPLKEVSVLVFPHHVCLLGPLFSTLLINFFQVHEYPCKIAVQIGRDEVEFFMKKSSFGTFAQQMSDMGLTFNITFTEDELGGLPNWRLFDEKIMDGISHLSAQLELPSRPASMRVESANSTRWVFVHCQETKKCGICTYRFQLPAMTPTLYTLEHLDQSITIDNPICSSDAAPTPRKLLVVGGFI